MANWVIKDKYLKESGLTEGRLKGYIYRHLTKGVHYQTHGKTTMINTEEMDKWWSAGGPRASNRTVKALGSGSSTKAKSTKKQSTGITTLRVISPQRNKSATG